MGTTDTTTPINLKATQINPLQSIPSLETGQRKINFLTMHLHILLGLIALGKAQGVAKPAIVPRAISHGTEPASVNIRHHDDAVHLGKKVSTKKAILILSLISNPFVVYQKIRAAFEAA